MPSITLRNATGTITATIKNIVANSAYPETPKNYTEHTLADGSLAFDIAENPVKRVWSLQIKGEDAGDNLLTNLNALYRAKEQLFIDEDALIIENNIPVMFADFSIKYQTGDLYYYGLTIKEM
jgi:hypothetical protein